MKKINVLLLFLTLGLVVSCEKNESSKIYSFSGKAQKGPYVQGTNITIQELKSNLGQTGKSFTTFTTMGELATVITAEITDIASTSAISGGNVTNDGGADVTARGVVWSTSLEPTIDNNNGITSDGDGDGEFTSSITDLESETTYYVRAYATNNAGTAYGDQFSFTTLLESFCGTVTFTCRGVEVTYGTVEGQNGTCWLDRNLGASRIATAYNDSEAYGDLFQWGRAADGHEKRNSPTTTTLSNSDTPGHGNFITVDSSPYDWRSPQNTNLWQGVNGINNPCPAGYRLPTQAEWEAELTSWSSNVHDGAFASRLKLPVASYRDYGKGPVVSYGIYWSSTVDGTNSRTLIFSSFSNSDAEMVSGRRAHGLSVRCIKDD